MALLHTTKPASKQKTRTFLKTLQEQGGPPIYTPSPQEARAVLSNLQAAGSVAILPADIENRTIPEVQMARYISKSYDLQAAMKLYLL
jgi:hypothetical protein